MPVVAVCPKHGPVNVERAFQFRNTYRVTLSGNRASCPRSGCSEVAQVMDGTYAFDVAGRATPISAPAWSRAALEAVQGPVQRINEAVQSELTNSEIAEQIDDALEELRARDEELPNLIAEAVELRIKGANSRSRMRRAANKLTTLVVNAGAAEVIHQGVQSPAAKTLFQFLADTIR